MELVFVKNVGERFKAGDVKNYPKTTWDGIARAAGEPLEDIAQPVVNVATTLFRSSDNERTIIPGNPTGTTTNKDNI